MQCGRYCVNFGCAFLFDIFAFHPKMQQISLPQKVFKEGGVGKWFVSRRAKNKKTTCEIRSSAHLFNRMDFKSVSDYLTKDDETKTPNVFFWSSFLFLTAASLKNIDLCYFLHPVRVCVCNIYMMMALIYRGWVKEPGRNSKVRDGREWAALVAVATWCLFGRHSFLVLMRES